MNQQNKYARTYAVPEPAQEPQRADFGYIEKGARSSVDNKAIPIAFTELEKGLYLLSERINELNRRLSPVSQMETPVGTSEMAVPDHSIPMVRTIYFANESIRSSVLLLDDMISRLEI